MKPLLALILLGATAAALAQMPGPYGVKERNTGYEEEAPWQEQQEVELPAFPKPEDLREFYVGAATTNTYLIDASTLAVGSDGVVRYVLVVKTSGGATNVSFEGIRCKERSWKHYAAGRSDSTWTRPRANRSEWRPIENKPVNRYHAALSRDYFCPGGIAIYTADEGRNALRLGKHPNAD